MTHLSSAEFVDWLDDDLPPARAAHLDACAGCRQQAEQMRVVLEDVGEVGVPEPSPLFWDHLPARVGEAVAATPHTPADAGWTIWPGRRARVLATAFASVALALALSYQFIPRATESAPAATKRTAVERGAGLPGVTDAARQPEVTNAAGQDTAWALVQLVADDVPWEQAHDAGISGSPGSVERMVLELSPREQSELARMLRDELKGSGS